MSQEEQNMIVNMLRDRFNNVDDTLKRMSEAFDAHVVNDQTYWKKIDQQEAQISLIKMMGGGLSFSGIIAWLYSHFGK